ncbi:hypothetical protein NPIL_620281 [Nephila pilipes]|uniref:Uncharacterized protein n=1 Tax=Nephila pilipes TaxID=299642 RepID=A0A8X6MPU3_NEPPI|nr:hypothetical protein NPIL_620281 [Nephila pilipes]
MKHALIIFLGMILWDTYSRSIDDLVRGKHWVSGKWDLAEQTSLESQQKGSHPKMEFSNLRKEKHIKTEHFNPDLIEDMGYFNNCKYSWFV